MFLANIPSPDQGVWHLGPISLRAYALCILAGILIALWWGDRRLVARGAEKGTVLDIAVWAVPFGLIGGRLYHVITDYHQYFGPGRNPLDALAIWNGGLGIWGAIALGGVGAWIACRRRGIPLPVVADAIAPGIIVAQAVGRVGNWFNQELYGGPTDLPWGLEIYQRVNPATGLNDPLNGVAIDHTPIAVVHPTFLYELLWNVLVALVIVWADRRFRLGHGRVFALYVAGYTLGRFWIELMRTDQATEILGVRVNVYVAALVFLGALVYLLVAPKGREDPSVLAVTRTDDDGDVPAGAGDAPADGDTAATPRTPARPAGTEPRQPRRPAGGTDRSDGDGTS
ncbi:prolipoprotein diacylglyceryl transferase [Actinoalloteichus sp. AHMU CJ021]|uniref:Phosphatidylglycerol--prolipoprotein diacylglyceryl transferase n=2 Tax=Actinoalloteichus cyanogriseus TaxID=2893586 RepID=A0ABT1JQX5_ACTCY|nr:prolipoprotein diacylglyceryl transferase [Actinoalloteichus sp. AHMU CJ021]MCP2334546.1 Prolipoprotein diacylglyceryl transferase [Actinoalloteichus caeruleus DSM 43889]